MGVIASGSVKVLSLSVKSHGHLLRVSMGKKKVEYLRRGCSFYNVNVGDWQSQWKRIFSTNSR